MKSKKVYICSECGARSPKWQGRCSNCGVWDSFKEEIITKESGKAPGRVQSEAKISLLSEIDTDENFRISTTIGELDRVLGGGIIPGSIILVGGDPGIGKSTLMLQMSGMLKSHKPLYVTGEESLRQIRFRADRLKGIPGDLQILAETNLEQINSAINMNETGVVVVDSIQSVSTDRVDAAPGSIVQVRECASMLMQTAKQTGKPVFIIGHVTKEGVIAGPKILEHMVDTVLQFEGEKTYSYRILRASKNRFGSTNEIGIFEMGDAGLREVKNPSELFLAQREHQDNGIAIVATIEGTRPILLEVQSLVTPSGYSVPQRASTGYDSRRLQMILAVLEKRLGLRFGGADVFVNLAGGVYMSDPSLDLGIAAALVSSFREQPIDSGTLLIGEIGLTGEVRPVSNIEQRIGEAEKLGFKTAVIPAQNHSRMVKKFKINVLPVDRISTALAELLG